MLSAGYQVPLKCHLQRELLVTNASRLSPVFAHVKMCICVFVLGDGRLYIVLDYLTHWPLGDFNKILDD